MFNYAFRVNAQERVIADPIGACALGKDHETGGLSEEVFEMATEPTPAGKVDSAFGDSGVYSTKHESDG